MSVEIAWAAGLFEGEGSWWLSRSRTSPRPYPRPGAVLTMADEDVVRRFHAAVGFGHLFYKYDDRMRATGRKPLWGWRCGSFEHIQALGAMFWPWLGERRRARFREVLNVGKQEWCSRQDHTQRRVSARWAKEG